jgi:hypothetical protein
MVESAPLAVEAKNPVTITNFMVAMVIVGSEQIVFFAVLCCQLWLKFCESNLTLAQCRGKD